MSFVHNTHFDKEVSQQIFINPYSFSRSLSSFLWRFNVSLIPILEVTPIHQTIRLNESNVFSQQAPMGTSISGAGLQSALSHIYFAHGLKHAAIH
jgi:hypothetical protein